MVTLERELFSELLIVSQSLSVHRAFPPILCRSRQFVFYPQQPSHPFKNSKQIFRRNTLFVSLVFIKKLPLECQKVLNVLKLYHELKLVAILNFIHKFADVWFHEWNFVISASPRLYTYERRLLANFISYFWKSLNFFKYFLQFLKRNL